jgi:hypothetical protein
LSAAQVGFFHRDSFARIKNRRDSILNQRIAGHRSALPHFVFTA